MNPSALCYLPTAFAGKVPTGTFVEADRIRTKQENALFEDVLKTTPEEFLKASGKTRLAARRYDLAHDGGRRFVWLIE